MIKQNLNVNASIPTMQAIIRMAREAPAAYALGVYLFGAHVITKAMRYTPVRTGNLRASRWVGLPDLHGSAKFSFELGFWAYYASAVHDSETKFAVGRSRFLETALDEEKGKLVNFMRVVMKKLEKQESLVITQLHPTQPMTGPQEQYTLSKRMQKRTGGIGLLDRYKRNSGNKSRRRLSRTSGVAPFGGSGQY